MQKHSQYCKNTENTANINLVTNRGIPNIHGGKLEISKDDEYYVIWFLQVFLLQLEAGRNFETFIVEYLRPRAIFKHWQKYHENSNKN